MDEIYLNIMERVGSEVEGLSLIDEDCGQLELSAEEDQYPVTYPCVLVGYADTEWSDLTGGAQRGRCSITVRVAVDCYTDTHLTSGTSTESVRERHRLAREVNRALRKYCPADNATALTRTHSREYVLPGGIKVFELTYSLRVTDTGDD